MPWDKDTPAGAHRYNRKPTGASPGNPGRPKKNKAEGRKPGTPFAHQPTDELRNLVMALRSCAVADTTIARVLDISHSTLKKHYQRELTEGKDVIIARIGAMVVAQALQGCRGSQFFYLKCQAGWRESRVITDASMAVADPGGNVMVFTIKVGEHESSGSDIPTTLALSEARSGDLQSITVLDHRGEHEVG